MAYSALRVRLTSRKIKSKRISAARRLFNDQVSYITRGPRLVDDQTSVGLQAALWEEQKGKKKGGKKKDTC